jgi:methyl-accepting chemotaxis protein/methyl-accepting chemotaxis protein-1 (serine sensor receptor)
MWSNVRIGRKLLAGFGAMLAVALALGTAWVFQSHGLTKELESAVNVTARKQHLAGEIRTSSAEMLAAENAIVLGSVLQRSALVSQSKQTFREQLNRMQKALADFRPLSDANALSTVSALEGQLASAGRAHEDMMQFLDKQQFDLVQKTFDDIVQPRLREIGTQAEALGRQEDDRLGAAATKAEAQRGGAYWMIALFMALTLAAACAVSLVVVQANTSLRKLASDVSRGAEQVASAAVQVCSASQSLAQCSSEQAAALEETSASMEEMSSVTHKNSENSRSTASLMNESEEVVDAAEKTVRELSVSMQEISVSGEKITKVVKMIDDIAFQTKILSLNAAVEAARAGAAGAGFAVVAEQIGHLAQECAVAARNTAEMIDDTVARVRDGGDKLNRAAGAIQEVVKHAARVKILVDEVNVGSQEQSKGIDQVSRAVAQMQQMTQQTAANAEETASAGRELDTYAEALNRVVRRMHTLIGLEHEPASSQANRTSQSAGDSISNLNRAVSAQSRNREILAASTALRQSAQPPNGFPMEGEFKEF